jgi:pimeloyl-ACP methyl ester carboxylesterase
VERAVNRRQFLAATAGGFLACREWRQKAAIFLHGFPLNSFQWRGAIERLSPYRRCIAPDFLGLGSSEVAPGQSVGPDAQVAMIVALMDRLSIAKADFVANDSGGAVAQLIVARHPERVRSLLLTNCDTEHDSPPPALLPVIELSKKGQFVDQWLAPWLADKKLARSAQGIGGMCYADPAHPTDEAIDRYFTPLVSSPRRKALVHAYAIALERNALAGIEPALRRFAAPVRIVWGTADTIFSSASPAYLDHAFGNSRGVRELAGRKLFWPEELPDVIAEEARGLWEL